VTATICPACLASSSCGTMNIHVAAQLQPIQALRLACGTQHALLPVAVGAMNIHVAAQLQPIQALRLACGTQHALLPVAVGAMNIHNV